MQGIRMQDIRDKRRKQTAEVFTPSWLVAQMLDKLPMEVWTENKTFCDPACGNGNFLVAILERKLAKGHPPLEALRTIYGVDIMADNVAECRQRLLDIVARVEKFSVGISTIIIRNKFLII
jgi:type I restriction-modification system DNA methylase subunit